MAKRPYVSPLRQERAEATRQRVLTEARRLFVNQGYGATTVRSIARAADVSEQTVYVGFETKRAILLALLDAADAASGSGDRRAAIAAAEGDPLRQVEELVGFIRRLFESQGDLVRLLREGASTHPDLAAVYAEGRARGRMIQGRVISTWTADALRPGVSHDVAADIMAAMTTVDLFDVLVRERGWNYDQVEDWLVTALRTLLLREPVSDKP